MYISLLIIPVLSNFGLTNLLHASISLGKKAVMTLLKFAEAWPACQDSYLRILT